MLAAAGWTTAGLATAGLGGLAGCDLGRRGPEPTPPPDALLPFLIATVALADRYDAAIEAEPSLSARLTPLRDDHRAHVRALAREIGTPPPSGAPSPSASGSAAPSTVQALLAAEQDAQKDAEKACLEGPVLPRRAARLDRRVPGQPSRGFAMSTVVRRAKAPLSDRAKS